MWWSKIRQWRHDLYWRQQLASSSSSTPRKMINQVHVLATQIESESDPQASSPLFTRLPYEIRHEIFSWVLKGYDHGIPYRKGTYHDRPGYHYHHCIDTALLRTCRRIYFETYLLPVQLNEIILWCVPTDRAPPDAAGNFTSQVRHWNLIRTVEQVAVSRVHLFAQQYWLESRFGNLACMQTFNPSILHITIRHTDWWWWENKAPLTFDPKQPERATGPPSRRETDPFDYKSWGFAFRSLHGLKEFVLELETLENKKSELDEIVGRAPTWHFPLAGDDYLLLDPNKTKYSAWRGVDRFHIAYPLNDPAPVFPYQTPRLKPQVVGMMEDMLGGTIDMDPALLACIPPLEATACVQPEQKIEEYIGRQHTPVEYASVLRDYRQTKWCTESEAAGSELQWGFVILPEPVLADINDEMEREVEELSALQYYIVKLTWNARHRDPDAPS